MKKSNAGRKKIPDAIRIQVLVPKSKVQEVKDLVLKLQNEAMKTEFGNTENLVM
jgi:hypothetical protein